MSQPKILIVDDDSTNISVLKAILLKEGYSVIAASGGLEAIEIAKSDVPNLILLDIMMPNMDGFDTCDNLQLGSITADIPIIFLSALDKVEVKVKAFDMGAVDYINKPFRRAEVIARVKGGFIVFNYGDSEAIGTTDEISRIMFKTFYEMREYWKKKV